MIQPRFFLKGQPKPKYANLLLLWIVWWLCLFLVLTLYAFYFEMNSSGLSFATWRRVFDLYCFEVEWEFWVMLSGLALLISAIHYGVLRLLRGDGRKNLDWRESVAICGLIAISVSGGLASFRHMKLKNEWRVSLWQSELNDELNILMAGKDYRRAVEKMEVSMDRFQHASRMLGERAEYFELSASGVSYLYTTCNVGWEHSERHMPMGLRIFLQNDGYPRKVLGGEMVQSSDPVLRCFGYWLIKDADFLGYAYDQAEKGNEACYGFAFSAAYGLDPDHVRAFRIASEIWRKVHLQNRTTDAMYIEIGARAEDKGHILGQYESGYQQALKRHCKKLMQVNQPLPDQFFLKAMSRHGLDHERKNLEAFIAQKGP